MAQENPPGFAPFNINCKENSDSIATNILKRGYSITLLNGKTVKSIAQVKSGDLINTIVFEGNIISIVKSTKKTTDQ